EQLPALTRRQTGVDPSVDAVLATPRIDRLLADTEIRGNLRDLAARRNELQNAATELRRITLPRHAALPGKQHQNPAIRLHETRGRPGTIAASAQCRTLRTAASRPTSRPAHRLERSSPGSCSASTITERGPQPSLRM